MSVLSRFSDLIPQWGPYSKKYMGISRIADESRREGIRFDVCVHPTMANSSVPVPNVTVPCGYHPWTCSNDLSHFSYRYDLEWKDAVYADVSFSRISSEAYLIRTQFVNNTELAQNCLLNIFSALEYPHASYCKITLPPKFLFKNAVDYTVYSYAQKRPWDEENPDGMKKGTFLDPLFSGGTGLGDRVENTHVPFLELKPFGAVPGDRVAYDFKSDKEFFNAALALRYRTVGEENEFSIFRINGRQVSLKRSDELNFAFIPIGHVTKGQISIDFVSEGTLGIEFDCLAMIESVNIPNVKARTAQHETQPLIQECRFGEGYDAKLHYREINQTYGILTNNERTRYRRLETGTLEDALLSRLSNADVTFDELTKTFTSSFSNKKSDPGFFHNTVVHSIYIQPNSSRTEYAVVYKDHFTPLADEEYEHIYENAKKSLEPVRYTAQGEKYALSNELLKSALLTNVVYPIYRHGEYIVHHTPGKRWDCLYTWDSGFIALGLLENNTRLAEYILDTYLSETDNPDFAFLHHGSPVPVQFYQYFEMLSRSNEKNGLYAYYDRAKQYYDFMAGKTKGSTTAKFKSGLTTTYDYFYSSSGMDDYPPQHFMIKNKLQKYACPCISTSQVIRAAKILRMIAGKLGRQEDLLEYEKDIERFTAALQQTAWDEEAGYFSYVLHDDDGLPAGFFKTPEGENLNKGMDGIYPLIAGVCTPQQKQRILFHLMNEKEMWSKVGISAVDRSASYYRDNGYWNGSVWFSHQWFIWKTMLDLGETDFAFKIADTALNAWKKETDHSYYTFEMLNIETGRGGWFHHFGGLSAPINIWTNAYYRPGRLSSGLDVWIDYQQFTPQNDGCEIQFGYHGNQEQYSMIAVLDDGGSYRAALNGEEFPFYERFPGVIELTFNGAVRGGTVVITRV